jgi:hypothetical protein
MEDESSSINSDEKLARPDVSVVEDKTVTSPDNPPKIVPKRLLVIYIKTVLTNHAYRISPFRSNYLTRASLRFPFFTFLQKSICVTLQP